MIRAFFATGALLAATASVARVDFSASGVSVGGSPVTEQTLQLRTAGDGTVLASRDKVESLGGLIQVALDGGRMVTLEPGVRLSRSGDVWTISAHAGRPMTLSGAAASVSVASPATVQPVDGGWKLGDGSMLEGTALKAAPVAPGDPMLIANEVPPDGMDDTPAARSAREKNKRKLSNRRLHVSDPMPGAEAADEQALKSIDDVSPAGF